MQLVGRQHVRIVTFLMTLGVMTMVPACAGRAAPVPQPTDGGQPTVSILASTPSRPDHVVVVIWRTRTRRTSSGRHRISARSPRPGRVADRHARRDAPEPAELPRAVLRRHPGRHATTRARSRSTRPSLAGELAAAGYSFVGYAEDLPSPGFTGCRAGDYARKHSPWTNFGDVPAAPASRCRTCRPTTHSCPRSPSSSPTSATTCTTARRRGRPLAAPEHRPPTRSGPAPTTAC